MIYVPKNHCQKQKANFKISVHVNNKTWKTKNMELKVKHAEYFIYEICKVV